jgi:DNA-directed RNA polymerase beta' subunit
VLRGTLAPASLDVVRTRAPKLVTHAGTLDFRTLTPERGGLFDYRVFGAGTVIDAPTPPDDEPWTPRATQFGRLVLAQPIVHPLLRPHEHGDAVLLAELPVLPPDLRPLTRLADDRWQVSPINEMYRRVVERTKRQQPMEDALLALFAQLRAMIDPDACARDLKAHAPTTRMHKLDAVEARTPTTRMHKLDAVLFALGFELRP